MLFILSERRKESIRSYFKNIIGLSFFGIFMVYLLSVFNSDNKTEYLDILKNKIPFLFIPLSLLCVETLEKKQIKLIQYIFISCALISSCWSCFQYLQNPAVYAKLYTQGEVIPTLIHHVSLAVLVCIGVLILLNNMVKEISNFEKIINGILLIWFILFIHILSVRTGIVLLYIGFILFIFSLLVVYRKPLFATGLILLLIISAYISYEKIPTIKSKIAYTWYGISQYKNQQDTTNQVSDSRRILSDKIGLEIMRKNKLCGAGLGDIQDEMNAVYRLQHPLFKQNVYAHIHNQYLYTFCGVGLIFGFLFCICLMLPLLYLLKKRNWLFSVIYSLLLLVMLWEPFIENQLGTSIFLIVCCLGFVSKNES